MTTGRINQVAALATMAPDPGNPLLVLLQSESPPSQHTTRPSRARRVFASCWKVRPIESSTDTTDNCARTTPLRRRPNPRRFSSRPVLWVISANARLSESARLQPPPVPKNQRAKPRRSFQPNVPSASPNQAGGFQSRMPRSPAGFSLIELCVRFRIANLHKLPLLAPIAALLRTGQLAPRAASDRFLHRSAFVRKH